MALGRFVKGIPISMLVNGPFVDVTGSFIRPRNMVPATAASRFMIPSTFTSSILLCRRATRFPPRFTGATELEPFTMPDTLA